MSAILLLSALAIAVVGVCIATIRIAVRDDRAPVREVEGYDTRHPHL